MFVFEEIADIALFRWMSALAPKADTVVGTPCAEKGEGVAKITLHFKGTCMPAPCAYISVNSRLFHFSRPHQPSNFVVLIWAFRKSTKPHLGPAVPPEG